MTHLIYLENTYQFTGTAQILRIEESEKGTTVILDETLFYPQGGGQPADQGRIIADTGGFTVQDVRLSPIGEVLHFGEVTEGTLAAGARVQLHIDAEKRTLHAQLHSAGHMLDIAVEQVLPGKLRAQKGYHFPQGPYVEYAGSIEQPEIYMELLQQHIERLIHDQIVVRATMLSEQEASTRGIWAPPGKSARVVAFGDHEGCGCGGTHVRDTSVLAGMRITKISSKKGTTRICYTLT